MPFRFRLLCSLVTVSIVAIGLAAFDLAAQSGHATSDISAAPNECPPGRAGPRPHTDAREATPEEKASLVARVAKSAYGAKMAAQIAVPLSKAIDDRSDATSMSYSPEHGTQVGFTTKDGRSFLWYPGNAIVLPGQWLACEERMSSSSPETGPVAFTYGTICYQYGENTYNPVTKVAGAVWECAAAGTRDASLIERRKGDLFDLARRQRVPFVLAKDQTAFDVLLKQLPGGKAEQK